MSKYECPNCDGGFPEPGHEKECPWCGQSLDKSYRSLGISNGRISDSEYNAKLSDSSVEQLQAGSGATLGAGDVQISEVNE